MKEHRGCGTCYYYIPHKTSRFPKNVNCMGCGPTLNNWKSKRYTTFSIYEGHTGFIVGCNICGARFTLLSVETLKYCIECGRENASSTFTYMAWSNTTSTM